MKRSSKAVPSVLMLLGLLTLFFAGCKKEEAKVEPTEPFNIAVFVPGVVAGSPLYEQLVEGTEKAAAE